MGNCFSSLILGVSVVLSPHTRIKLFLSDSNFFWGDFYELIFSDVGNCFFNGELFGWDEDDLLVVSVCSDIC